MKALWLKSGAVASTALFSVAPLAATTAVQAPTAAKAPLNTTTAEATVAAPVAPQSPYSLKATSYGFGPQLSNPGSKLAPSGYTGNDATKSPDATQNDYGFDAMSVEQKIEFGYKLSKKISLAATLDFTLNPVDASSNPKNEGFHWLDSYLKASYSGIVEKKIGNNDVALDGQIRLFLPTSKDSRDIGQITAVRTYLMPSIQFGKSPWSISNVSFVEYRIHSNDTRPFDEATVARRDGMPQPGTLTRLKLYTGPQLNYAFNDKVTAWLLYEATVSYSTHGMPNTLSTTAPRTDIEPGADIVLHERLTLSPYLNWYPMLPLSTTSVNLTAAFKLL